MIKIRNSGKDFKFTSKSYTELAAVVYADIFGYPLTVNEAKLWAIRKTREEYSTVKFNQGIKIANVLKNIPTIEAIFLTGSVAAKNASKNADVDLMIITSQNTAWITRLIVFSLLKIIDKFKNPICPNIFLDVSHLEIKDKNLFTAHEILQAKCLYEKNKTSFKWLNANKWVKEYLPNAYRLSLRGRSIATDVAIFSQYKQIASSLWLLAMTPLELFVFLMQHFYMKSKITSERIGWGYMFFHPNDLSSKILKKFDQRLLKYTRK